MQDFGADLLERVILGYGHAPATVVIAALEDAVADFAGAVAPFDDIAMVVVRRLI